MHCYPPTHCPERGSDASVHAFHCELSSQTTERVVSCVSHFVKQVSVRRSDITGGAREHGISEGKGLCGGACLPGSALVCSAGSHLLHSLPRQPHSSATKNAAPAATSAPCASASASAGTTAQGGKEASMHEEHAAGLTAAAPSAVEQCIRTHPTAYLQTCNVQMHDTKACAHLSAACWAAGGAAEPARRAPSGGDGGGDRRFSTARSPADAALLLLQRLLPRKPRPAVGPRA